MKITIERDNLDDLIVKGISVGMTYQEIMNMNMRRFLLVYRGRVKYLENFINNTASSNFTQLVKFGQTFLTERGLQLKDNGIQLIKELTLEKMAKAANADDISQEIIRENIFKEV